MLYKNVFKINYINENLIVGPRNLTVINPKNGCKVTIYEKKCVILMACFSEGIVEIWWDLLRKYTGMKEYKDPSHWPRMPNKQYIRHPSHIYTLPEIASGSLNPRKVMT